MSNLKNVLQKIFSVKNTDNHKCLTILGIKISSKTKNPEGETIECKINPSEYNRIAEENCCLKTELDNVKQELVNAKNELCVIDYQNNNVINNCLELICPDSNTDKVSVLKKNLLSVEIEIFSYCNRQCWFCPNKFIDRHSKNIFMDENLYFKILSELKSIDYDKTITYARYNEPLADKIFLTRLKQAREYCPNAFLTTNSNGDFLTREYLDELADSGLNRIELQGYMTEEETYSKELFEKKINILAKRLNLDWEIMSEEDYGIRARLKYDRLSAEYMFWNMYKILNNRGESLKDVVANKRTENCLLPYLQMHIDYNGKCMLCCNLRSDIKEHEPFIVGDVNNETLSEVFSGEKIVKYRKLLGKKNISLHPCSTCAFIVNSTKMNLRGN